MRYGSLLHLAAAAALARSLAEPNYRYERPRKPAGKMKLRPVKPYRAKVHPVVPGAPDTREDKYLHSAARRRRQAECVPTPSPDTTGAKHG